MNSRIKSRALEELIPGKWILDGDNVIILDDDVTLDHAELAQKCAEVEYKEDVEVYKVQRAAEYPDFGAQLDHIYHSGIDDWKTNIVDPIKAKYPKVEMDASVLAARKSTALADYQAEEYIKATTRLAQYQLSVGVPESSETIVTGQAWNEETLVWEDVTETIVIPAIEALEATVEETTYDMETDTSTTATVANPVIVKDNEERAAAQAIIDATPVPVKTHVDG
jgi:hypothetical protein